MIKPMVRIVTLLVMATLTHATTTTAQDSVVVPDFTKGAKLPRDSRHDWNLGPTGFVAGCFATSW